MAADSPDYQASVLTVPRVDTPAQVGQYQDATLRLGQDGKWQLESLRSLENNYGLTKIGVMSAEAIKTESFPVGVYLRTQNGEGWVCDFDGTIRLQQRRQDKHFEVAILAPRVKNPPPHSCIGVAWDFRLTIPLDVYGLSAGTYTYDVNGVTGSFTLTNDNKYADDCKTTDIDFCPP
jgi:inhibitor of cysteine peptidase